MKLKACLAAIALAAGVAAGSPAGADVSVVKVPSPALLPGSTYAWSPVAAPDSRASGIVDEVTTQRLAAATESILTSKGYRPARDPSEADLFVVYRVLVGEGLDANLATQGGRCEPSCPGGAEYHLESAGTARGSLVLDLYDRRSGRLVYRATSETVSRQDASPERISSVLRKMTSTLPL